MPIIYDKDQVVQGKILLSYCLIEKEKAENVKHVTKIEPQMRQVPLAMFCLGYARPDPECGTSRKSSPTAVSLPTARSSSKPPQATR